MKLNISRYITDERRQLYAEFKDVILTIMIVIDLLLILSMTIYSLSNRDSLFISYFDLVVCILLFFNLIDEYKNSDMSLTQFIKANILEIISIIPFNLIFMNYFAFLKITRLVRIVGVFQLVKLVNFRNYRVGALKKFIQNRLLKAISIIVIIYFIVVTIVLYALDPSFPTIFDSAWYLLETLTSVGYGDIIPVTIPGRMMGVLTIVLGVFFVSIFTAAMSALYVEVPEKETRKKIKDHMDVLEQQNEELKRQVDNLNKDIVSLHEKIDKLTLLIDREDDDET